MKAPPRIRLRAFDPEKIVMKTIGEASILISMAAPTSPKKPVGSKARTS